MWAGEGEVREEADFFVKITEVHHTDIRTFWQLRAVSDIVRLISPILILERFPAELSGNSPGVSIHTGVCKAVTDSTLSTLPAYCNILDLDMNFGL